MLSKQTADIIKVKETRLMERRVQNVERDDVRAALSSSCNARAWVTQMINTPDRWAKTRPHQRGLWDGKCQTKCSRVLPLAQVRGPNTSSSTASFPEYHKWANTGRPPRNFPNAAETGFQYYPGFGSDRYIATFKPCKIIFLSASHPSYERIDYFLISPYQTVWMSVDS